MRTMYFDTGVRPEINSSLYEGQVWRNGTKQIPFDVDAPESAVLLFACNTPDLPESKIPNIIVREIFNSTLCSRYAYLRI